ncbi:pro-resilin-like isoform X2 [Homarus americanus]|uniref:pro-resilin-like isoform X2 n=1 Tax=Homarus americanus TaxID=6706 RepID=UPI001C47BB7F|nr:pro-resilin-like isoform X2 [Homarus americanus]
MKVYVAVLVAVVAVSVSAFPEGYNYEQPKQSYLPPEPSNRVEEPQQKGMPYDFEWDIQNQDFGNAFSHVENSDGSTTQGEYRVLLPDGRTQVVKFFDKGGGYNADVTYEK